MASVTGPLICVDHQRSRYIEQILDWRVTAGLAAQIPKQHRLLIAL